MSESMTEKKSMILAKSGLCSENLFSLNRERESSVELGQAGDSPFLLGFHARGNGRFFFDKSIISLSTWKALTMVLADLAIETSRPMKSPSSSDNDQ